MSMLKLSIIHDLPGRLRLRLGAPTKNTEALITSIGSHEGMESIDFNPVTRSLLIYYKPTVVSGIEITVRCGIALSIEKGNMPVEIYREGRVEPLKPLDYYAGGTLLLAVLGKTQFFPTMPKALEMHGAAATSLSVLSHAWKEAKEEGVYHPETLSAVYLIGAMIQGNILKAGVLTWLLTFGRHLLSNAGSGCIIKALEVHEEEGKRSIDAVVRPSGSSVTNPINLGLKVLSNSMGIETMGNSDSLMENILGMSKEHGHILEGLKDRSERVYMRINQG